MTTVILGPRPPEIEAIIERRRQLGHDSHDEVWEGVYHMVPYAHSRRSRVETEVQLALGPLVKAQGLTLTSAFNLGDDKNSFRVPDFGVFAEPPDALFVPTALIVGEVLSPNDETFEKIPYYRAHGVSELFVVDPDRRTIEVHHLQDGLASEHSDVLDLDVAELAQQLDWP